jgi:NADH dehydrogenase
MLAVTGRNAAVVRLGKYTFTGFPAWVIWLGVHLYRLIGFRNRLSVLINWAWDYLFYDRVVRLITPVPESEASEKGC